VSARRVPTRNDLHRFWIREGWEQVQSTHHPTFELKLIDGVILRSHCSNPIDGSTIDDPKLWRNILADQLMVTAEEFWACVDDDELPKRGADGRGLAGQAEREPLQPLSPSLTRGLMQHLGMSAADLEGVSQEAGEEMLSKHWQERAAPSQQTGEDG
jgi:hypothetical protein